MILNKQKVSHEDKVIFSKLMEFYFNYQDIIDKTLKDDITQKEKKDLIKTIYEQIKYTNIPTLEMPSKETSIDLYRGINADSEESIKKYASDFSNGEVFFGKNASIYGTGIYMSTNASETFKYATYFDNPYGAIINCKIDNKVNIIEYEELVKIKDRVLEIINEKYKNHSIKRYSELLEDCGLFASILGYDAIRVKEKDYVIILNREKLFVSDINYINKIDNTKIA